MSAAICRSALLLLVLLFTCAAQTAPASLNGRWQLQMTFEGGLVMKLDLSFSQRGADLSGDIATATATNQIKGTIKDGALEFTELIGGDYDAHFKGKLVDDNMIEGTMTAPPYGEGKWAAKRVGQ